MCHDGFAYEAGKDQADLFFMPKKYQQKYSETHKTLPDDHVLLICFFEKYQNTDQANGILNQVQKEKTEKATKKLSANAPCECGSKMTHQDQAMITAIIAATTGASEAIKAIATGIVTLLATSHCTSMTNDATVMGSIVATM